MNPNKLFIGTLSLMVFVCLGNGGVLAAWPFQKEKPKGPTPQNLYHQALTLKDKGDLAGARELLDRILKENQDFDKIEEVQNDFEELNLKLITNPIPYAQAVEYKIQKGDTLEKIAKKFGTTIELLQKRNQLKNSRIIAGESLSVWNAPFNILIDKSQNILILKNAESVVKSYMVSTGKAAKSTPTGDFTITNRMVDPVWFHHGVVVPAGTPENFLGTRWLGFNKPQYGIHGTIEPELIGQSVSSGCVRMRNQDVEELYDLIPPGTKVRIIE